MANQFEVLLDCIVNDLKYKPEQVIDAIDGIAQMGKTAVGDANWTRFSEAVMELKWAYHYPTMIENPDDAMRSNPGFYADLVLWQGWAKTYRMKNGSNEVAGPA